MHGVQEERVDDTSKLGNTRDLVAAAFLSSSSDVYVPTSHTLRTPYIQVVWQDNSRA